MNSDNTNKSKNIHIENVQNIWEWISSVVPSLSSQGYKNKHIKYINKIVGFGHNPHFGSKLISPDEAQTIPDNSAYFKNFSYKYERLSQTKSIIDKGFPVALISWHHGALHHSSFAVARVLPQIALFSFWSYQVGKVFAYPMEKRGALSLIRMDRFLNEGRPILYFFDGPPLGKCIKLQTLGVESELSTAPISIIRLVKNVQIVPVTSYYEKKDGEDIVSTIFHDPLPEPAIPGHTTETEILSSIISVMENDLCKRAPEQIMMSFFKSRELNAQKIKENMVTK